MLSFSALLVSLSLSLVPLPAPQNPDAVRGVVVDSSGRPIPRASVSVIATDGRTTSVVFTDGEGAFRIAGAPDGCRVQRVALRLSACRGRLPDRRADHADAADRRRRREHRRLRDANRSAVGAGGVGRHRVRRGGRSNGARSRRSRTCCGSAPGTTVVRVGAPGGVTSLFVRAGESNYTKVLLDGIPLERAGRRVQPRATSRRRTSIVSSSCAARTRPCTAPTR